MKKFFVSALMLAFALSSVSAKDKKKTEDEGYVFTTVKELKITPVKNQNRTGTCWCFSTLGFLESELLRMGKGEYDLSEMFIVSKNYKDLKFRIWNSSRLSILSKCSQSLVILNNLDG